ncbi:MAG: VOC family protein [Pseudomonadota bacterium]
MNTSKVLDLKAFVPAKDFDLSRRFYLDLGFKELWANDQTAELQIGEYRFLLQKFYVKEHSENFMMSLTVENADTWWEHINSSGLKEKYNLYMAKPPTLQPWGLRVLYLTDPSGVLWHIADKPK